MFILNRGIKIHLHYPIKITTLGDEITSSFWYCKLEEGRVFHVQYLQHADAGIYEKITALFNNRIL